MTTSSVGDPDTDDTEDALTPEQLAILENWGDIPVGFEMVNQPPHPRLVVSIWGDNKTGKTAFALTCPTPVVVINFDFGLDALFYTRPELIGKVLKKSIMVNETMIADQLAPVLLEFEKNYQNGIEYAARNAGTIVIDTTTQLWQIVQDVKLAQVRADRLAAAKAKTYSKESYRNEAIERAEKPSQLDYGKANLYMAALLRKVHHYPTLNAVFINKAKPQYNDDHKPTGAMEYHGFGEMPGITDVHIQLYKKTEPAPAGGIVQNHYGLFTHCRYDTSMEGLWIKNPTYETVRGMLGIG